MMYRNTPHTATGKSQAKHLFGRDLRTPVPVLADNLRPSWPNDKHVREKDKRYEKNYKQNYDKSHGVRDSSPFIPGQAVRIKTDKEKKWEKATVTQVHDKPRSYLVTKPDGSNAKHIRTSSSPEPEPTPLAVSDEAPGPTDIEQQHTVPEPATILKEPTKTKPITPPVQPLRRSSRVSKPPQRLEL